MCQVKNSFYRCILITGVQLQSQYSYYHLILSYYLCKIFALHSISDPVYTVLLTQSSHNKLPALCWKCLLYMYTVRKSGSVVHQYTTFQIIEYNVVKYQYYDLGMSLQILQSYMLLLKPLILMRGCLMRQYMLTHCKREVTLAAR